MSQTQRTDGRKVLLELKKLKKHFILKRGVSLKALEDISFEIYEGEKFGVVGESGCGKSTLGRVILQLYPQTSGACIYYGKSLEEMAPRYVEREIRRLLSYQAKARDFYQKSLAVEERANAMEKKKDSLAGFGSQKEINAYNAASKQLDALRSEAKELRKEASRQLREGSRTIGSLILSEKLPEIQPLFAKAQEEMNKAHAALSAYTKMEAKYAGTQAAGAPSPELAQKMVASRELFVKRLERAKAYRAQAFAYRGKHVAPITELCLDPVYQAKLDRNYETGINLGKLTGHEMRALRRDMQMIFQDPAASLDPRQSVGRAIEEVFLINTGYDSQVRKEKAKALLETVGLKREHYHAYPHALSGGQKQRVGIARAIALDPRFVILDESVSALDVSVQAQILELLNTLSEKKKLTYFFITHDLGVVKHFCNRILVMYLGHVCELADSKALFHRPLHPYTESLLASVPRPVIRETEGEDKVLEGEVPSAVNPPKGCPFHTRCPHCMEVCRETRPPLIEVEKDHFAACYYSGIEKSEEMHERFFRPARSWNEA